MTIVCVTGDKILPVGALGGGTMAETGEVAVERRLHRGISRPMTSITNVLARMAGRPRSAAPAPDPARLGELARGVIEDLSSRLGMPCDLLDFRATRTGSLTIRLRADRPYVAKMPLQASTEPRLRRNAETLQALGQLGWVTPFLAARWPALLLTGTASGGFYTVETTVAGQDGASLLKNGASPEEMLLSAERFLLKLHKASMRLDTGAGGWEAPFEAAAKRVEELARRAGAARPYAALVCDITNRLAPQAMPSVYSHGNFWLGNALFDASNNLTGVIDWDCSDDSCLPALDLIYLLVRTHGQTHARSIGEALADWIAGPSMPFLDGCIARHCLELSIPADLIVPLAYCAWIQHLDGHCRYATATSANRRWLQRNVRQVLDPWQSLSTAGRHDAGRWRAAM